MKQELRMESLDWVNHLAEPASLEEFVNVCVNSLNNGCDNNELETMALLVTTEVDRLWGEIKLEEPSYDCHKGCSWCCYQNVSTTLPELLVILRYLYMKFDDKDFQILKKKLIEKSPEIESKTTNERLDKKNACIFLENNTCSIHPARPLQCRGGFSQKKEYCENLLNNREATQQALKDGNQKGEFLIGPKLIYNSAQIAIVYAMRDVGLKGVTYELSVAISLLIESLNEDSFQNIYEKDLELAELKTLDGETRTMVSS